MATFDQLPADQRAIIELLLKRKRSYDALSDMLDMPPSRVRELAREALTELAPYTAERVDPDWRAQVADYVLNQQSGPESAATQGHLKRSEPARAWLLSLLDSLDQLYANGSRPEVPAAEGERTRARDRRDRERGHRDRDVAAGGAAVAEKERKARDEDEDEEKDDKRPSPLTGGRKGGPLSPAARAVVRRRRLVAGAVAGAAVLLLVLILTGVLFGGDDDDEGSQANRGSETTTNANQPPTQLIGQLQLDPVDKSDRDTIGVAAIAKTGNKMQLAVQAKLPPRTGERQAYEVWLYNSREDAVSLGAQRTDREGNYQGAGEIPVDYKKYKFIDISAETVDQNREHSGRSVVRGAIANLVAPQQQQGGQGGQGGGPQPAPAPAPAP